MSVQRFKVEELNCCFQADMVESEDGDYVLHSDYAALASEIEHLKTRPTLANQYAQYAALAAENDLLRKAVEASLEHFESGFTSEYRVVEACKAALHGGSTNPPDPA